MIRTRGRGVVAVVALIVGVLAFGLIAAACGSSKTSATTPSPSPSPTGQSTVQKALALKTYINQVKPIYTQVLGGISALDGSVKGLTKKPGPSWTTSANKMTAASQQFGAAVTALQAITPPPEVQSVQDGIITALQSAQKVLDKTAAYLNKRVYDPSYPDPKTQIKQVVKAKLMQELQAALQAVVPGASGSPAPSMTP